MREQHMLLRAADVEQALGMRPARMVRKHMADAGVLAQGAKGVYGLQDT